MSRTQSQFFNDGSNMSDTTSIVSSVDDDKWGAQIGGYNENNPSFPPPPATLLAPREDVLQGAQVVDMHELEQMLDRGFEPNGGNNEGIPPVPQLNRYQLSERGPPSRQNTQPPQQQQGGGNQFDAFGPLSPASSGGREPIAPRMRELSPPPRSNTGGFAAPPPLMGAAASYGVSTGVSGSGGSAGHIRKRSNGGGNDGDWGPMGPLGSVGGQPPTPKSAGGAGSRGKRI